MLDDSDCAQSKISISNPKVRVEMVVGEGFEPSKSMTADLQSAPFGRSGTPPRVLDGAGYRNRTGDLLITSQLLYLLS